ncbi:MAG TPA: pilus assembly protein TadG-related protein [Acidimicrobiales bacterium]|nr:pilus assembly protein TadG-related protein [Acidimicrobiales bacterium]
MEERGQVLPLVAVMVVAAGVGCLVLGRLGGAAVARAQAVTAADAAALAGAAAGRDAARVSAKANGARMTRYEELGLDVRVEVELGGARASARARRRPPVPTGPAGVAPGLRAALARAEQILGRPVPVVRPAAGDPGRAHHLSGLAVDVAPWVVARLAPMASQAGLCRPHPQAHPVHFELCPHGLP